MYNSIYYFVAFAVISLNDNMIMFFQH